MNSPAAADLLANAQEVFTFAPAHYGDMDGQPGLYRAPGGDLLWVEAFDPDRPTTPRRVILPEALTLLAGRMRDATDSTWDADLFPDLLTSAAQEIQTSHRKNN